MQRQVRIELYEPDLHGRQASPSRQRRIAEGDLHPISLHEGGPVQSIFPAVYRMRGRSSYVHELHSVWATE